MRTDLVNGRDCQPAASSLLWIMIRPAMISLCSELPKTLSTNMFDRLLRYRGALGRRKILCCIGDYTGRILALTTECPLPVASGNTHDMSTIVLISLVDSASSPLGSVDASWR
ncbi:hypothetical protein AB0C34_14420 [Nocardia sp. NPDC049220]|uniref:hypothetical protein n=1 Tax=Nocardia sp. NPDC049220 TaxID=3155273 RepID=UPI0033FF9FDD